MKHDLQSNHAIAAHVAPGVLGVGDHDGTALDMSLGGCAAFIIAMTADGTDGTLTCKLQHSADGSTDWTDEVDGAGNSSTAVAPAADGDVAVLYVNNPRRRFYRVRATSDAADVTAGVVSVHGPLNSVAPA